jgi:cell wall-associated NlpC family hydrolase
MSAGGAATMAPAASAATHLGDRTLRSGLVGNDVKELQKDLNKIGFKLTADGEYGTKTADAVWSFQKYKGLQPTGSTGPHTVEALNAAIAAGTKVPSSVAKGTQDDTDTTDTPTTSTTDKNVEGGAGMGDVTSVDGPVTKAKIRNGLAIAPAGAPAKVKALIAAGNRIAKTPYVWGGGHGSWKDSGYDCSGSVSYALHYGGMLHTSMTSGDLEDYGKAGNGKWITIYANSGHTFMKVAGISFNTSGANPSRWQKRVASHSGYVVRHPKGF